MARVLRPWRQAGPIRRWFQRQRWAFQDWTLRRRLKKEYEKRVRIETGELLDQHLTGWPPAGASDSFGYATRAKPRTDVVQNWDLVKQVELALSNGRKCPACGKEIEHEQGTEDRGHREGLSRNEPGLL